MTNSKVTSIFTLCIMFIYFLFSQIFLTKLGNIYYYIINPIFFILIAIITKFTIQSPYKGKKFKKTIWKYIIITTIAYLVVYMISGIFQTYGKNPYSVGINGILLNLYSTILIILCREYIRYKVINNVFKKDKKIVYILTVITFTMQEISTISFSGDLNIYYIFKLVFSTFIPSVAKNCLFTYIAIYSDYWGAFIYELIMHFILWIPPILPNSPWIYTAILDTVFPVILLIYCMYYVSSKDKMNIRECKTIKPTGLIPLAIGIVFAIWFAIGIFPIKPIGIASNSMAPNFNMGDAVIIQKCNVNAIDVNTVIEYKIDNTSIIHRVIEKHQKDGDTFLITKGDNNSEPDKDPVMEDQIQGKVIAKIPYIAWPIIWIKNLRNID